MKSPRILALCALLCLSGAALWVPAAAAAEPEALEGKDVVFTVTVQTLFPGFPEKGYYRFSWRTIGGSAMAVDKDFEKAGGKLYFSAGSPGSHRIRVRTLRDCRSEGDEYFAVRFFKLEKRQIQRRDGRWGSWYAPLAGLPETKDVRGRIIDDWDSSMTRVAMNGGTC